MPSDTPHPPNTLARLLDALFPSPWRAELQQALDRGWRPDPDHAYCHRCGHSAGAHSITADGCSRCLDRSMPWDRLVRLSSYQPPVSDWVRQMKFHAQWRWADCLGDYLARALIDQPHPRPVPESDRQPPLVCWVPMPMLRRWSRGYNQARLLAEAVARRNRWTTADLLYRARHSPPQSLMPASRRRDNVRRAFAARRVDLTGRAVWLIDDVTTSHATLRRCAMLLRDAGAASLGVAVVAVAEGRRHPRREREASATGEPHVASGKRQRPANPP